MAHIYPTQMTDHFSGAHAAGEKRVYTKLAEELGDDWCVFHDLKWDDPDLGNDHPVGQADFVIVHPERGFLVLEVKGGRCAYRAEDRIWETTSGENIRAEIKDPFDQAAAGARVIWKLLMQTGLRDHMYIPHGQSAALFPDCSMPKRPLRGDVPAWRILDQEDLFNLSAAINRLFDAAFGEAYIKRSDGLKLIDQLKKLWGTHDAEGRLRLDLRIRESFGKLMALTEQQCGVLKSLRKVRRLEIRGCAGSGKTTLAIHKAKMLAEDGQRVGLFCFNIPLSQFLKRECRQHDTITVGPIAELCQQWLGEVGVPLHRDDSSTWWDETLPNMVVENLDRIPHRFDAVVIDEAQDIRENYWPVIELMLSDQESASFYVFADQGQNIYDGRLSLSFETMPFELNRNVRNTNQVFGVVKACCGLGDDIEPSGIDGLTPVLYRYEDNQDMLRQLRAVVERLCAETVQPSDMVVLGTHSQARTSLKYGEKIGPFPLVAARREARDLLTMTVHKFKGLEAGVVILCELDEGVPNIDELLYIGMTRTTGHLIVLAADPVYSQLKKAGFRSDRDI